MPETFGAYALLQVIGRGGSGTAHLALPLDPLAAPGPVVLKILNAEASHDELDRARFEHEAKLAVATNVPALATVYDVGMVGDTPYIAMELVRGMSISRLLTVLRDRSALLPLAVALDIARSALAGLKQLHDARDDRGQGLEAIHRDLSPSNLMLEPNGRVRILDLGVGRSRLRAAQTRTGVIIGTPGYMSPEQVLSTPVSQRADVYTLGTIFWELLAGRRYIQRGELAVMLAETVKREFDPPSSYRMGLPPSFDEVCRSAMEREPERRFGNATEFLRALESLRPSDDVAPNIVELQQVYRLDLDDQVLKLADEPRTKETVVDHDTLVIARRPQPIAQARSSPQMITYVAVLGVLTAVLSVAVLIRPPPEPSAPAQVAPSPVVPVVLTQPAVQPRESEEEPPPPPIVDESPAPAPAPARKKTPEKEAPAAAAVVVSIDQLISELHQLARSAKRAQPERAAAADELLNAGLFEAAAGDTPAVRARLRSITAELKAIAETREARRDP